MPPRVIGPVVLHRAVHPALCFTIPRRTLAIDRYLSPVSTFLMSSSLFHLSSTSCHKPCMCAICFPNVCPCMLPIYSCWSCMYKAPPADMPQLCRPSLAGRHGHASPAQDGEEASVIYRLPSPMASKLDILFTFTSSGTCRPSSMFCTYKPP
jgi:hypothetical protein